MRLTRTPARPQKASYVLGTGQFAMGALREALACAQSPPFSPGTLPLRVMPSEWDLPPTEEDPWLELIPNPVVVKPEGARPAPRAAAMSSGQLFLALCPLPSILALSRWGDDHRGAR